MKEPLPKFILIGFRTLDLNDLVDISFTHHDIDPVHRWNGSSKP